jgi:hypothetical protein
MLRLQWKWQKSIWRKKECQCCRYRECQCMIIKNVHRISAYVSLREICYNYKRRGCFSAVLPLLPLTRRSGRCYLREMGALFYTKPSAHPHPVIVLLHNTPSPRPTPLVPVSRLAPRDFSAASRYTDGISTVSRVAACMAAAAAGRAASRHAAAFRAASRHATTAGRDASRAPGTSPPAGPHPITKHTTKLQ